MDPNNSITTGGIDGLINQISTQIKSQRTLWFECSNQLADVQTTQDAQAQRIERMAQRIDQLLARVEQLEYIISEELIRQIPTDQKREIVEGLGHGWQIERQWMPDPPPALAQTQPIPATPLIHPIRRTRPTGPIQSSMKVSDLR